MGCTPEVKIGKESVVSLNMKNGLTDKDTAHLINRKYQSNLDKCINLSLQKQALLLCLPPLLCKHGLFEEMPESSLKAEAKTIVILCK